ncbi:MAG: hypothetical protein KAI70_04275 [Candidatus Omnitrophica bacterium]|nr:hypothetical protein [Candidatus Omnitrophota bacterium]
MVLSERMSMTFFKNKIFQISAAILSVVILITVVVFVDFNKKTDNFGMVKVGKISAGFTFFDIGENTQFSNKLRSRLKDKLGSDAKENWVTLDLSINYQGFLQEHFPELHELNKKLNSPVGERVEHNTTKLTFRYAQQKSVPFEFVQLVFSNYTNKPLLIYIKSKKEGSDVIDTITKKYGDAKTIDWDKEEGKSLYWMKNRSTLIISISDDRYGNPEYHTIIYYVPNLEELLLQEQQTVKKEEEEIKKTGKTAF